MSTRMRLGTALVIAVLASCIPADETELPGSLVLAFQPGDALVQGIPSAAFADGWAFTFERFLLATPYAQLRQGEEWTARSCQSNGSYSPTTVFDARSPYTATYNSMRPGPCPVVSVQLHPPYSDEERETPPGPGATPDDVRAMSQKGSVAYIAGVAVRGAETKRLALSIPYVGFWTKGARCAAEKDGRELDGVVVVADERETVPITILAEHMFRDTLAPGLAPGALRFDPIAAADADKDGSVTYEELEAVKLATLATGAGAYANPPRGGRTLADFVSTQLAYMWRFREKGQCAPRPEP